MLAKKNNKSTSRRHTLSLLRYTLVHVLLLVQQELNNEFGHFDRYSRECWFRHRWYNWRRIFHLIKIFKNSLIICVWLITFILRLSNLTRWIRNKVQDRAQFLKFVKNNFFKLLKVIDCGIFLLSNIILINNQHIRNKTKD